MSVPGVVLLLNSSPPTAAYMRRETGTAMVQVMACRLFGAKPLPAQMLAKSQLDCWVQISVKFESEFYRFHSRNCIWKCHLSQWRPFCPGGDELTAPLRRGYSDCSNLLHRCAQLLIMIFRKYMQSCTRKNIFATKSECELITSCSQNDNRYCPLKLWQSMTKWAWPKFDKFWRWLIHINMLYMKPFPTCVLATVVRNPNMQKKQQISPNI